MHNLNAVLLAAEMEPRLFDLDFQLLADSLLTIIAVFVLFIALSYLLFNPARKFMQDRQNKIAGELDHAKTAQEDAEKLKADYEARLANVDKEADEILSAARAKALANEADIVAKARRKPLVLSPMRMWKPNWKRKKRRMKLSRRWLVWQWMRLASLSEFPWMTEPRTL